MGRARGSIKSWSTRRGSPLAAFGEANIIEDPNLFYAARDRAAGSHARGSGRRPDRGIRPAEDRASHRARAAAREEPVRARLHPGPRIHQGQSDAAGSCRSSSTRTSRRPTASSTSSRHLTTADIQRVARTYFTPANRLVLTVAAGTGGWPMTRETPSARRGLRSGERRVCLVSLWHRRRWCLSSPPCLGRRRRAPGRPSGRLVRSRHAT